MYKNIQLNEFWINLSMIFFITVPGKNYGFSILRVWVFITDKLRNVFYLMTKHSGFIKCAKMQKDNLIFQVIAKENDKSLKNRILEKLN